MRSQLLPLLLAATAAPTTTLAFGNNMNPRQPQDVTIQTNTDANNGFVPITTTTITTESTWHTVPSDRPVPTTTTAAAVNTATVTATTTTTTTTKTSTAGAARVTGLVGGAMGVMGVLVVGLAAGL